MVKGRFNKADEFYFEDENEAGSKVLLNYGVLNFEIINKKKVYYFLNPPISDLI